MYLIKNELSFYVILYSRVCFSLLEKGMQINGNAFGVAELTMKFISKFGQVLCIVHVDVKSDTDVDSGIL